MFAKREAGMFECKLAVYIGYDPKEDEAWEVARHSLLRHSSANLGVYKLKQDFLRECGLYLRLKDNRASTEFSLTRFLTPYLADNYEWAIFVDCDFLFTADIYKIFDEISDEKAVYVVKHNYTPKNDVKMDGAKQSIYPRKNWSSFILFNLSHPGLSILTPRYVNNAEPSTLHQFKWLKDEEIGELNLKWNFLEGEYPLPEETPYAIHYTNGGPWFKEWKNVDYGDLWRMERQLITNSNLLR